jgi:hypothetical protein
MRTEKKRLDANRRLKALIDDYKAHLLMLQIQKAAGILMPQANVQLMSLYNLIPKYEAILTQCGQGVHTRTPT